MQTSELSCSTPDPAGRGTDEDAITRTDLGYLTQADVGRPAGHPENSQVGRHGDAFDRTDPSALVCRNDCGRFAIPSRALRGRPPQAGLSVRVTRPIAPPVMAWPRRKRSRRCRAVHAATHVRIDADEQVLDLDLAGRRRGRSTSTNSKSSGTGSPSGCRGQPDLRAPPQLRPPFSETTTSSSTSSCSRRWPYSLMNGR